MYATAKAAIFDLDGVLLDTEPLYTQATQQIVGQFGKTYTWDVKRKIMGGTAMIGARVIVADLGLPISPEEYLMQRRSILEHLFRSTAPIAGAEALVRALVGFGLPLAIATSSERALFELKTEKHPWFALFSTVVCGDDPRLRHPKPAPDIFHMAARALSVDARDCVIFEDSPAGVCAAIASGARVVARRDPAVLTDELAIAHIVVDDYAQLDLAEVLRHSNQSQSRPGGS